MRLAAARGRRELAAADGRAQADGFLAQLKDLVARQIALRKAGDAAVTNDALFAAARDCRRQAQAILNTGGRREVVDELVAQAELLESAAQPLPGPAAQE